MLIPHEKYTLNSAPHHFSVCCYSSSNYHRLLVHSFDGLLSATRKSQHFKKYNIKDLLTPPQLPKLLLSHSPPALTTQSNYMSYSPSTCAFLFPKHAGLLLPEHTILSIQKAFTLACLWNLFQLFRWCSNVISSESSLPPRMAKPCFLCALTALCTKLYYEPFLLLQYSWRQGTCITLLCTSHVYYQGWNIIEVLIFAEWVV